MPKKKVPSGSGAVDRDKITLDGIPGLEVIDALALYELGIRTLTGAMNAMDANDGDLTKMSTPNVLVTEEMSDRIGRSILQHPAVPDEFKSEYEDERDFELEEIVDDEPLPAPPWRRPTETIIGRVKRWWREN